MSAGTSTFETRPSPITAPPPAATSVAPTTPPISACEELEGSPKYHVIRFQVIAPIRPGEHDLRRVITPESTIPFATVAATSSEMNAPTKLRMAAQRDRDARRDRARRDRGRDDVRRVVESVGEVERERRHDDDHEDQVTIHPKLQSAQSL